MSDSILRRRTVFQRCPLDACDVHQQLVRPLGTHVFHSHHFAMGVQNGRKVHSVKQLGNTLENVTDECRDSRRYRRRRLCRAGGGATCGHVLRRLIVTESITTSSLARVGAAFLLFFLTRLALYPPRSHGTEPLPPAANLADQGKHKMKDPVSIFSGEPPLETAPWRGYRALFSNGSSHRLHSELEAMRQRKYLQQKIFSHFHK
jgi:hypothetical protein